MALYFLTGNSNKVKEAKEILGDIEQLDIDLPEIQEIDSRLIIKAKLKEALNHHMGEFIVEDTSLYLNCMKGLPGPLIKWFMTTIGNSGLYKIAEAYGNFNAKAKTMIGYAKNEYDIQFFEGEISGKIIKPVGTSTFGWDPIFVPDGSDKSFGEMKAEEKNNISMRKIALEKLKPNLK